MIIYFLNNNNYDFFIPQLFNDQIYFNDNS